MEKHYAKNIEAIKKYQPNLEIPEVSAAAVNNGFSIFKGADGLPNIMRVFVDSEIFIHEKDNCVQSAALRTGQIEPGNGDVIISFGLGLGYEAREIIKKMKTGTNLLIVEPSPEIFQLAVNNVDLTDIFSAPNVRFFKPDFNKEYLRSFIRKYINGQNYKNTAAFVISPYVDLYLESFRSLFITVEEIRSSLKSAEATVTRFSSLWQTNVLLNTGHFLNSLLVSDFFGKLCVPAVIVSAGPSLSKNVHLLRQMEDNVLIICVDTALKPLLENGITPHFIVSVDAQDIVAKKFENVDYHDIPLLYIPVSSRAVVDNHIGVKILSPIQNSFYSRIMRSIGKDPSYIDMGGSVATVAFTFAQSAGANPIILIGQDLAYTDLKTHTEGAAFASNTSYEELAQTRDVFTVLSVDGGQVLTDVVFETYAAWFEAFAASDKDKNRVYIDATEGGAKLNGFMDMRLSDVLSDYSSSGVNKLVSEVIRNAPLLSAMEKKRVREAYKASASFMNSIKGPANMASKHFKQLSGLLAHKKPTDPSVRSIYTKIAPIDARIKANKEKLDIIAIALAPAAEKLNYKFEQAEFKSEAERNRFAAECYSEYYGEIAQICSEFSNIVTKTFD